MNALRADIPGALSQVITQCLAKDPNHRIQTVSELAAYLEPFAQEFEAADARGLAMVFTGIRHFRH